MLHQKQGIMKKSMILILLLFAISRSHAQVLSELFNQKKTQLKYLAEQIAALKAYSEYIQKGYQIAKDGLTLIGDIKNKDFSMHKDYFASLRKVSPSVGGYKRIADIVALQRQILACSGADSRRMRESGMFTEKELVYIAGVFARVLEDSENLINDLVAVTTDGKLTMKDDERIKRIDGIYQQMQSDYVFTRGFGSESLLLAACRQREIKGSETIRGLHGINQ
jgi:hypothetical protein